MARFDRSIPPGGEGSITFGFNIKNYSGKFRKTVTVITNDPKQSYFELVLQGEISPQLSHRSVTFDN